MVLLPPVAVVSPVFCVVSPVFSVLSPVVCLDELSAELSTVR